MLPAGKLTLLFKKIAALKKQRKAAFQQPLIRYIFKQG